MSADKPVSGPEAIRKFAEMRRQTTGDRGDLRVFPTSHALEAELETVKDVLVRLKPTPPPNPKLWATAVAMTGPLVLVAKVLRDAATKDGFTLDGWNLLFLVIGIGGAVAVGVMHWMLAVKAQEEVAKKLVEDIHHARALSYIDRLIAYQHEEPEQKFRVSEKSGEAREEQAAEEDVASVPGKGESATKP